MAKNKMLQAVVSLAGTIDLSLGKALDDVTGKLENVNWKAVAVGGAVGGIAVATGKAVVEAGKYLADLGNEYNTAINQLSAATGATGDELDALGESVKNIYAQGLGDDFADVADGLAATQQASDLTGEALERATAAGFNLRDVFDYDVSESARAASALMKNFGIDAEEAYGLIAVGAQNGADKNGDLLDTLNEYSPQFAALGLSADQFIGTLVEGADAGLFSIDKVGDAVKEFNIRQPLAARRAVGTDRRRYPRTEPGPDARRSRIPEIQDLRFLLHLGGPRQRVAHRHLRQPAAAPPDARLPHAGQRRPFDARPLGKRPPGRGEAHLPLPGECRRVSIRIICCSKVKKNIQ